MEDDEYLERLTNLLHEHGSEDLRQAGLEKVTGRRSRIVILHLLEHGSITTEELEQEYGYAHPPRAVRDVREQGIPITTGYTQSSDGRRIAEYTFGDLSAAPRDTTSGRVNLPRDLKSDLLDAQGRRCSLCLTRFPKTYLHVDHRVPYQVADDEGNQQLGPQDFMLVCKSCNRAKSWACEHCDNATRDQAANVCEDCYWCHPKDYEHIALVQLRRIEIVWKDHEIDQYQRLSEMATLFGQDLPEFVKRVLRQALLDDSPDPPSKNQ